MRIAHKLSILQGNVLPEHILFVDTETTQTLDKTGKIYQNFRLGVAIYHRKRRDGNKETKETVRFKTIDQFWSLVESKALSKTVLYLMSHNAVFDFTVLEHITQLSARGYKCSFVYEGGMTFIGKWRKDKHTILILDTANWFKGTLAKWGNELELEKLQIPQYLEGDEKWFIYCERDTEILYQLFTWYCRFLVNNDLGNWKYTIASGAFTAYRHRFMHHHIYIPDDEQEKVLARQSYHGGRTECFKIGDFDNETFYKLDINSMYPYVMRNNSYPTCFDGYFEQPSLHQVEKSLDTSCIIAYCNIKPTIPYFVFRHNERNIYPNGEFGTVLTTNELKLCFKHNWILSIESCCKYRKRDIFTEYVDFFYQVKQQASLDDKPLLKAFAKLYLNSLYGKFGQRGFVDKVIATDTSHKLRVSHGYNMRTRERFTVRQVGQQVLYSEKGDESYNSFCAIASHVTANARIMLYELVLEAGRDNCYYSDTDSIIVNSLGMERLRHHLDNFVLGKLKIEEMSTSLSIRAPKDYTFGEHTVRKGVRKNAQNLGDNTFKQEVWPGLNTILKSGQERYFNYFVTKHLTPKIISGDVQSDGTIQPFVIS